MSFSTLGLAPELLAALDILAYVQPTPIQIAAIPAVLEGRDVLAAAQTGTGKTAAFALPLLHHLKGGKRAAPGRPRALVMTPTRELAAQVEESIKGFSTKLPMRSCTMFGGVGMQPQIDALRRGVDILVATPGRLIDHLQRRTLDLSAVEFLVLDEADRMLDMGFLPAVRRILSALPRERQTLLFSATFAPEIKVLAQQFMRSPVEVQVSAANSAAPKIEHRLHPVDHGKKRDLLLHLLSIDSRQQRLVFSRTKHGADKLCRALSAAGHKAAAIHGNKSQNARTRALDDFKSNRIQVLVATDIAARGIDIEDLPVVINYDLPMVAEDYVHRIGRALKSKVSCRPSRCASPLAVVSATVRARLSRRVSVATTAVRRRGVAVTRRTTVPVPMPAAASAEAPAKAALPSVAHPGVKSAQAGIRSRPCAGFFNLARSSALGRRTPFCSYDGAQRSGGRLSSRHSAQISSAAFASRAFRVLDLDGSLLIGCPETTWRSYLSCRSIVETCTLSCQARVLLTYYFTQD